MSRFNRSSLGVGVRSALGVWGAPQTGCTSCADSGYVTGSTASITFSGVDGTEKCSANNSAEGREITIDGTFIISHYSSSSNVCRYLQPQVALTWSPQNILYRPGCGTALADRYALYEALSLQVDCAGRILSLFYTEAAGLIVPGDVFNYSAANDGGEYYLGDSVPNGGPDGNVDDHIAGGGTATVSITPA